MRFGLENLRLFDVDQKNLDLYKQVLEDLHLDYAVPGSIDQKNWRIPNEYKEMDIENYLVEQCPEKNYQRLMDELALYKKHDMLIVLKTMKYIVDTLRKNNLVWGVGRGSSVASYCLYLLGVHKVDSVKYNIPVEEFFKEM